MQAWRHDCVRDAHGLVADRAHAGARKLLVHQARLVRNTAEIEPQKVELAIGTAGTRTRDGSAAQRRAAG